MSSLSNNLSIFVPSNHDALNWSFISNVSSFKLSNIINKILDFLHLPQSFPSLKRSLIKRSCVGMSIELSVSPHNLTQYRKQHRFVIELCNADQMPIENIDHMTSTKTTSDTLVSRTWPSDFSGSR